MSGRAFDQYSWLNKNTQALQADLADPTDTREAREAFVGLALKLEQQLLLVLIDEACQAARGGSVSTLQRRGLLHQNPSLAACLPGLQILAYDCAYQMVSRYEASSTVVRRLTNWQVGAG